MSGIRHGSSDMQKGTKTHPLLKRMAVEINPDCTPMLELAPKSVANCYRTQHIQKVKQWHGRVFFLSPKF